MLKLGIVGLPNVGKSSPFNALTAAGAAAESKDEDVMLFRLNV